VVRVEWAASRGINSWEESESENQLMTDRAEWQGCIAGSNYYLRFCTGTACIASDKHHILVHSVLKTDFSISMTNLWLVILGNV
jgi:hypothetical protein